MAKEIKTQKLMTPMGRIIHPCLHKTESEEAQYDAGKSHVTLLIPKEELKNSPEGIALRKAVLQVAQDNLKVGKGKKKKKPTKLSEFAHPFKDGDEEFEEKGWEPYKGNYVIRCKSNEVRPVIGPDKEKLSEKEVEKNIKMGDYGRAMVNVYAYFQDQGGVSLGLQLFQYWKTGPALAGASLEELLDEVEELDVPVEDVDEDEEESEDIDADDEEDEEEDEEEEEQPKKKATKKKKTAAKKTTKKKTSKKKKPEPEEEEDDEEDEDDEDDDIDLDDL